MTGPEPPNAEPAPPPTYQQLQQEAAERPKSLRLLPCITADAVTEKDPAK